MRWPALARKWTEAEIVRDSRTAGDEFRKRRLGEPKERYLKAFAYLERANKTLLGSLHRLRERPVDAAWVAEVLSNEHLNSDGRFVSGDPGAERSTPRRTDLRHHASDHRSEAIPLDL